MTDLRHAPEWTDCFSEWTNGFYVGRSEDEGLLYMPKWGTTIWPTPFNPRNPKHWPRFIWSCVRRRFIGLEES